MHAHTTLRLIVRYWKVAIAKPVCAKLVKHTIPFQDHKLGGYCEYGSLGVAARLVLRGLDYLGVTYRVTIGSPERRACSLMECICVHEVVHIHVPKRM